MKSKISGLFVLAIMVLATPLRAFVGSDDFNDNSIDPSKWTSITAGGTVQLREANGTLQCQDIIGTNSGDNWSALGWIHPFPFTASWKVMVDTSLPSGLIPLTQGLGWMQLFIGVRNINDTADSLSMNLERSNENNLELAKFTAGKETNDTGLFEISSVTTSTFASLQIGWDATLQQFNFSYDPDGGQDGFINLGSVGIADWNTTTGDTFEVGIGFGSEAVDTNWDSGIYMDNFNAVAEPGSILLCVFGGAWLIRRTRKKI